MNQDMATLDKQLAAMIQEQSAKAHQIAEDGRMAVADMNARIEAVKSVRVQIPDIPVVKIPQIPKF